MKSKPEPFQKERERLVQLCAEHGWTYEPRNVGAPVYQLARIIGPGFKMVAYPHKTRQRNLHIRLRDDQSRDKLAFVAAVEICYVSAGNNCTFKTRYVEQVLPRQALYAACHAERPLA